MCAEARIAGRLKPAFHLRVLRGFDPGGAVRMSVQFGSEAEDECLPLLGFVRWRIALKTQGRLDVR